MRPEPFITWSDNSIDMAQKRTGDRRVAMVLMVIAIVSAFTTSGLVVGRGQMLKAQAKEREKGPEALAFHLVTVDGKRLNSTDLRGRPVLLDLMATWCVVCRDQMPMLNDTFNKHKDKMAFVSIDMDQYETDEQLRAFRDQYKAQWPFAMDRTGSVFGAFYPEGYPTLVLLDSEGRVVYMFEGGIGQADLDSAIGLVL